ncbi:MAG: suppressor of fused domain protein [Ruminococcus sp.]|nr:suppressor of fused domain protein [Ruminococcus sp.]
MPKKKSSKTKPLETYTEEQEREILKHIEKNIGEVNGVFTQKEYEDIKVNIHIVSPTPERRFYTLVTVGMGAHIMNVPEHLKEEKLERAELVICLPPSWKIDGDEPEHFWPLNLLNHLAHLPISENAWLGWGHTIEYNNPFADNTELSAAMIVNCDFGEESHICKINDDDEVNFYQILPIYNSELEFKSLHGAKTLLNMWEDFSSVVDIDRRPFIREDFRNIIDSFADHSWKIEAKELDISDINASNHISAYLRWNIEHNFITDDFAEFFDDDIKQILSGKYDIRKFFINQLGGELTKDILTEEGQAFAEFYYDFYCPPPSYPSDVDKMAEAYFGTEKYNCDEFADEAYLFVPFNDDYISAMYRFIDHAYSDFCYYQEHGKLPGEE